MSDSRCARCGLPLREGDLACPGCGFPTGAPPAPARYAPPYTPPPSTGSFAGTPTIAPPPAAAPHPPPSVVEPRRSGVGFGLLTVLTAAALVVGLLIGFGSGYVTTRVLDSRGSGPSSAPNAVVFHDSLKSNVNGWASDTHCGFKDGGYLVKNNFYCLAPTGAFGNVAVSVKARQVAGPTTWFYGIVVRQKEGGNFYEADIDSNGKWLIRKVVNDQSSDIKPYLPNPAIKHGLGVTNTLKVIAVGSHITWFVNGTEVGQVTDSTFSAGRVGLSATGPGVQVVYKDLTISTVR